MLGEDRTLNRRGKPKQTLRCRLFGHKTGSSLLVRSLNDAAMRDEEIVRDLKEGWGCQRLGCGFNFSRFDAKADAIIPKLLRKLRQKS